jgi:A/G-specific adenine glycosylase
MVDMDIDAKDKITFTQRLLEWHKINERHYPWRATSDPFKILIVEFMLQKTDAAKVQKTYKEFVERFPTPELLAEAKFEEVLPYFEKIGLHCRAKRLIQSANQIVTRHRGIVPASREQLRKLPGVGDYTANAVLCFSCNKRLPLVDSNTIRIMERVFKVVSLKQRPRTDKRLFEVAKSLIPPKRARRFNLALLDFAAQICTHRNPHCDLCPVNDICKWEKKQRSN